MDHERKDGFAQVLGSPGTRVRFTGVVRLFWPFALGVFVAGYLTRCGMPHPPIAPDVAGLALLALAGAAWWSHGRALRRFGDFLKGARGEELVARELSFLPGNYVVFHGVPFPGGDFDHVVVGPAGLAVIETKHWSGPVTYADGEIFAQGLRPSRSPIAQVRRAAGTLSARLSDAGVDAGSVLPVLCLAGNTFEREALECDGLIVCNARSLCAMLLKRLEPEAGTSTAPEPEPSQHVREALSTWLGESSGDAS